MMNRFLLLILLLATAALNAQQFAGEIFLRDTSSFYLNQIYVTNLNEHRTVLSSVTGQFRIQAKPGDKIRFTSIVTERKDITVTEKMLEHNRNIIELKIAYHDIQEVVISKFKPTGNLKKDVLSLKTGEKERKLKEMIGLPEPKGDGTSPQLPVASFADGGLNFSIESIYDILSGERKKKERLQAYERMNVAVTNIKSYFGAAYFEELKIPNHLIDNFLQFVYSSDDLQPYLLAGNYEATKIYIERYLPIYQRRLKNSSLMETVTP